MIKKNTRFIGEVEQLNSNGLGVLTYQNQNILVKDVFVGEKIEVSIVKKIKEGYFGKVIKIKEASSKRCKVTCPYYNRCGGCDYLHMLYPFELANKQKEIEDLLQKRRLKAKVAPVCGMEDVYGYRNKCILTFQKNKTLEMGFYEKSTHSLVNIDQCLIHDKATNELFKKLKKVVTKSKLSIYNERYNQGFLKHIQIRRAVKTNELLLTIVSNEKEFKGKKNFLNNLLKEIPEVTSVVQNINRRNTSVVLGDEEIVLYGKGYIVDELCGMKFRISSRSFYQVNHDQCEKLYQKAIDLLELKGNELVLDAYCGTGTIGMVASKKCKEVLGVEINPEAIKDAKANKQLNQCQNINFICDDASDYMLKASKIGMHFDCVIMDPTREGSDERFMDSLMKLAPKKVVYISCNPKTQVRDLKYLSSKYAFKEVYPFDMFPRTKHVESIVLLERK